MTIFTLYQYTNRTNGKRYIGLTDNPTRRAKRHASSASRAPAFKAAIKMNGFEAFDYKVLALFDDMAAAAYHEQAAILKFGTLAPDGYNLTARVPYTRSGGKLSQVTRAKISASMKGTRNAVGNQNHLGHVHSIETRAKISAANLGNKAHLGHTHTAETRAQISAAKRGRPWSAARRAAEEAKKSK